MTRGLCLIAALLVCAAPVQAQQTLEQLLDEVRQSRQQVSAEVAARLNQFRQQRDQQRALLDDVQAQLAAAQRRSDELSQQYDSNEQELAQIEENLRVQTADMQEVFGIVRQFAGDALAVMRTSLVSAQLGERTAVLRELAQAQNVPPPAQMRDFHVLMLEEMAQSGKVVRFNAPVVTAAGEPDNANVVRVGTFNLIDGGSFLRYDASTGTIQELPRQPATRFRRDAAALAQAASGVAPMAIDPSQGALLGMLIQVPSLRERIDQGGAVGYTIIGLGALGLLIGLHRLLYLGIAGVRIGRQLHNREPRPGNALGRVLSVYHDNPHVDTETLELRLDEQIMRETPRLEQWQIAIKVIAAVAPLLGLLGTVIGMIETFQAITLFGTGDPKLMADGISQALVTTMLGLLVAIPMVLLHSLIASRSKMLIEILEAQSAGIVAEQAEKEL